MTSSSEIQSEIQPEIQPEIQSAMAQELKTDSGAITAEPAFGWTDYAERINGRFAMIGLMVLLLLEWFSRQDFFTWLGLR